MTQKKQIEELRHELEELKQRISLLESRPRWAYPVSPAPYIPNYPQLTLGQITA